MTSETKERPLAHGMLMGKKDECFHCGHNRRLILPEERLCIDCSIRKARQDRDGQ